MDSNSLPMVPDLSVFPRYVRYGLLVVLTLSVTVFVLMVFIGIIS